MKNDTLKAVTISLGLLSTQTLIAQAENQINQQAEITVNCQLPATNCDNSSQDLNCHLMMNPSSIEEGTKAMGKALGILRKGEITTAERVAAEEEREAEAGRGEVVNAISSNSSHQVLRLRGGGPKPKKQLTGGFKSTGDSSEEEDTIADPDLESEDTQPMSGEVNKYLKNEIINNIYTECLAEVAKLTLGGGTAAGDISKETAEWAAAKEAAEYSKRKAERAVIIATKKTEEAKGIMDEAKKSAKTAARVPMQGSAAEQAVITTTINYEKAREAYTITNYEATRLAVTLAEAHVETEDAVLYAISVRNTGQQATAEAGIDTAKEVEEEALAAVEAAKGDAESKENRMNDEKKKLEDVKNLQGGTQTNITPAMRAAMKEFEEDKTVAEAARSRAKTADLAANALKIKAQRAMNDGGDDDEMLNLQVYAAAENSWIETAEGYKIARDNANKNGLDTAELTTVIEKAEKQAASWASHIFSIKNVEKARAAEQMALEKTIAEREAAIKKEADKKAVAKQIALEKATVARDQTIKREADKKAASEKAAFEKAVSEQAVREKAAAEKEAATRKAAEKERAEKEAKIQAATFAWEDFIAARRAMLAATDAVKNNSVIARAITAATSAETIANNFNITFQSAWKEYDNKHTLERIHNPTFFNANAKKIAGTAAANHLRDFRMAIAEASASARAVPTAIDAIANAVGTATTTMRAAANKSTAADTKAGISPQQQWSVLLRELDKEPAFWNGIMQGLLNTKVVWAKDYWTNILAPSAGDNGQNPSSLNISSSALEGKNKTIQLINKIGEVEIISQTTTQAIQTLETARRRACDALR